MVLQKILRDLILIAQPFSCSFSKWVLFYTRSAITLSVEGEQSFASVPASLAFLWRLWGIWGKFDCNWHSQCPVRRQSSQSKTLYAGTERVQSGSSKPPEIMLIRYCSVLPAGSYRIAVLYDFLEKTWVAGEFAVSQGKSKWLKR